MHYDFIEIGTSNFDTLIEGATNEIGLSIEPIKIYLDDLPNKPNVTKVNCAISNIDGIVDVYYVDPIDIEKHGLHHYWRGCNSIINPHSTAQAALKEKNLDHLMKKTTAEAITWLTLTQRYNISSVDYLKIDTEGHDCHIINNMLDSGAIIMPTKLLFEFNILTSRELLDSTLNRLVCFGYEILDVGDDVVLRKKQ
jgi:FkbM family methyltransferase